MSAPRECHHPQTKHEHGTHAAYVLDQCKCQPCRAANTRYERHRRRQIAYGRWISYIDAEPARAHVRALQAAGMGLKGIAKEAGVGGGVMTSLMYGKGTRPPSKRIRPQTAEKILSVTSPKLADRALVPAIGARRRIQALMWCGWSALAIAEAMGVDAQRIRGAIERDLTQERTARLISACYDRMWDQAPPANDRWEQASVTRTRRYARTRGWVGPLAWDDDEIDNPDAEAHVDTAARRTIDDLVQDFADIRDQSTDLNVSARRLGVTPAALEQACRRTGRGDLLRKANAA